MNTIRISEKQQFKFLKDLDTLYMEIQKFEKLEEKLEETKARVYGQIERICSSNPDVNLYSFIRSDGMKREAYLYAIGSNHKK